MTVMAISQKAIESPPKVQPLAVALWGQPAFAPGLHMVLLELIEEANSSQLPTDGCHPPCFVKFSS